jgi:hypothetical protein
MPGSSCRHHTKVTPRSLAQSVKVSDLKFKAGLIIAVLTIGFAWYVAARPMDFRVYYHGIQGVFDGTRPVYGDRSGMGWPMHYRYPPLFLFIAAPFTLLSLPWAAAIWTALKCGALFLLIRALWQRLGPAPGLAAWLVPLLLAGPYVVEDLRYGNAQSFIFALTAAALFLVSSAPLLAAFALAVAISIKVWPLFFIPFLVVRRQWKVAAWTLAITAVLLLLPSLYFGLGGNLDLLAQWARQEFSTQTGQSEIWFPSQSLRGVLMRYLTVIDYTQVPDSNYPLVHIAEFNPNTVRLLWVVLAGIGYCGLLFLAAWKEVRLYGVIEGLAFAMLVLLEPFSQKYALVVLLWPAIVAGRVVGKSKARGLLYVAMAVAFIQPLVNGAAAQRLEQVLGFDFLVTALLAAFLVASIFGMPTERYSRG